MHLQVSLHPHILMFKYTCLYLCILTSSYFQVHACIRFFYSHTLIKCSRTNVLCEWAPFAAIFSSTLYITVVVLLVIFGNLSMMNFPERNSNFLVTPSPTPYTCSIFHHDYDMNRKVIWLWPTQRQTWKRFCNFIYFFQIPGTIHFPKIQKSTPTVNLYSEFSCKIDLLKLILQSRHIFGNPTELFVFGINQSCFWQLKIRILAIFIYVKVTFFNKIQ